MPKIGLWENALFAYTKNAAIHQISFSTVILCAGLSIHTEHALPHKHASSPWPCTSSPDYAQTRNKIKKIKKYISYMLNRMCQLSCLQISSAEGHAQSTY